MLYMHIGKMLEEQLLVEKTRSQRIQANAINTINQITYDGYNMITLRNSLLGFQSDLPLLSTNDQTSTDLPPLPTTTSTITASNVLPLPTPSVVNDTTNAKAITTIDVSYQPSDQHTLTSHPASDPAPIQNQDSNPTSTTGQADIATIIDSTIPAKQHNTNTTHTHPINSPHNEVIDPDTDNILTNPPETNTVLDQLTALYEVQQRLITRLNDLERGSKGQNYDPQLSDNKANDNYDSRDRNSSVEQQVVIYNDTNDNTTTAAHGDDKSTTAAVKWASTSGSNNSGNSSSGSSSIIKAVIDKNNNRDTNINNNNNNDDDDEMRYTFKDSNNNNDQSTSEGHNYDPFLSDDITVTKRSLTRRRSRYNIYIRICLDIFLICTVYTYGTHSMV